MPASTSNPAGSDSGAPSKFPGGSKNVQKVDKGKKRRTDSEERRAAEEEEEERLQADIEAADAALADQIRRRIQRNEEERRDLLWRQAALHSSRPWIPSVAPTATSPAPAVTPAISAAPAAPEVSPPVKRGRGRPPRGGKAPKPPKKVAPKKTAPPRKEFSAHSSSGRGEEEDGSLHESDESDKELEDGMSA